uniref:BTB domain-containing protein n=1 Tax=Strongyloides stercoralis TaxID=6248 RepID=A0A0K0ECG8_STRER
MNDREIGDFANYIYPFIQDNGNRRPRNPFEINNSYINDKNIFDSPDKFGQMTKETDSSIIEVTSDYFNNQFAIFSKLREDGHFCDFVIKCANISFSVHRIVICGLSEFFKAMLTNNMVSNFNTNSISLSYICPETMEAIINFAYTGRIKISERNVEDVASAASYLQIPILLDHCVNYMTRRIKYTNAVKIYKFIKSIRGDTDRGSMRYIEKHFLQLSRTTDFLQLDYDEFYEILKSDHLLVDSELQVLEVILSWISYDIPNRLQYISKLYKTIRLGLVSIEMINDKFKIHPIIPGALKKFLSVEEANNIFEMFRKAEHQFMDYANRSRHCQDVSPIIYAIGEINKDRNNISGVGSVIECYDKDSDKWFRNDSTILQRKLFAVVYDGNSIVVLGGNDGSNKLKSVSKYDRFTLDWKNLPSMLSRRSALSAATINSVIYAIGGYDGSSFLNSMEFFNPQTLKWHQGPSMTMQRSGAAVVVYQDLIIVIGGRCGQTVHNSIEIFCTRRFQWKLLTNALQVPRFGHTATIYNKQIFIFGGNNGNETLKSCECFFIDHERSYEFPSLQYPRANASSHLVNNSLYVFGGYNDERKLGSTEIFSFKTNQWNFGPFLRFIEGSVQSVIINTNTNQIFIKDNT